MIALAIVSLKPIVILDEPTSGLCKGQMASTVKYLQKMKEEGKTVIVITHNSALAPMADRVIHIRDAKVKEININENPVSVDDIDW